MDFKFNGYYCKTNEVNKSFTVKVESSLYSMSCFPTDPQSNSTWMSLVRRGSSARKDFVKRWISKCNIQSNKNMFVLHRYECGLTSSENDVEGDTLKELRFKETNGDNTKVVVAFKVGTFSLAEIFDLKEAFEAAMDDFLDGTGKCRSQLILE
ncbi:hypothetical protein MIR68_006827 [Amoeboaphelidium protococcarum]|nr:hypothetical protein MIR68_006827 [Amoeboaphelidium protococcarum]